MKIRVLSSVLMLAVFVPILLIGGTVYAVFIALLSVLALRELLKIRQGSRNLPFVLTLVSLIFVVFLTLNHYKDVSFQYSVEYWVIAMLLFTYLLPLVFISDNKRYNMNDALYLIGSVLFIGISFGLMILIRNYNFDYVIYIFLISMVTDTFALFTGKNVGKHKLAPKISPKKTVEGLIGGTLVGSFLSGLYFHVVVNPNLNIFLVIFITICLSLLGQLGDLVFSFIKREHNQKDFSNIIPGHGGILDRLDNIIFVALGFLLFLVIM